MIFNQSIFFGCPTLTLVDGYNRLSSHLNKNQLPTTYKCLRKARHVHSHTSDKIRPIYNYKGLYFL